MSDRRMFFVLSDHDEMTSLPPISAMPESIDLDEYESVEADTPSTAAELWMECNGPCVLEGYRSVSVVVTDGSEVLARYRVVAQWHMLVTVEAEAETDPDDDA